MSASDSRKVGEKCLADFWDGRHTKHCTRDNGHPGVHQYLSGEAAAEPSREQELEHWHSEASRFEAMLTKSEAHEREAWLRLEEALTFLKQCAFWGREIVSTTVLTESQVANFREAGLMYVEPGGGLGWVVRKASPPQWQADQEREIKGITETCAAHKSEQTRLREAAEARVQVLEQEIQQRDESARDWQEQAQTLSAKFQKVKQERDSERSAAHQAQECADAAEARAKELEAEREEA